MQDMMLKTWVKTEYAVRNGIAKTVARFHRDTRGGVAEYAVVVGLAVVGGIAVLSLFWEEIGGFFVEIVKELKTILGFEPL